MAVCSDDFFAPDHADCVGWVSHSGLALVGDRGECMLYIFNKCDFLTLEHPDVRSGFTRYSLGKSCDLRLFTNKKRLAITVGLHTYRKERLRTGGCPTSQKECPFFRKRLLLTTRAALSPSKAMSSPCKAASSPIPTKKETVYTCQAVSFFVRIEGSQGYFFTILLPPSSIFCLITRGLPR